MPLKSTRAFCTCGAHTKDAHKKKILAGMRKHPYSGPGKSKGKHALREGK